MPAFVISVTARQAAASLADGNTWEFLSVASDRSMQCRAGQGSAVVGVARRGRSHPAATL